MPDPIRRPYQIQYRDLSDPTSPVVCWTLDYCEEDREIALSYAHAQAQHAPAECTYRVVYSPTGDEVESFPARALARC